MRRLCAVVIGLTFVACAAFADEESDHLVHLRSMLAAMSKHGPVVPQPDAVNPLAAKTFNITAFTDGRTWTFTPSSFSVNQGDVVTVTLTVPSNDASPTGHGILMDTYISSTNVSKGQTRSVTFTATTAGTFAWVCTQSNCGAGHSSMVGQMVVNAVAGLSISSISPSTGSTAGGTVVTISGSGFVSGATVTFGGVAATNVNVMSSTTITATTPLGPATQQLVVDVMVTNPDGTSTTLSRGFSYTVPPLAVSTISPPVSSTAGGTLVTISGTGFTTALNSSVTFGGAPSSNVTVINAVTMQATAPAHATGTVDIVVTVGNNSVTKTGAFTYQAVQPRRRAARH